MNVSEMSELYAQAYGQYGDAWLIGALYANVSDEDKERLAQDTREFIARRLEQGVTA